MKKEPQKSQTFSDKSVSDTTQPTKRGENTKPKSISTTLLKDVEKLTGVSQTHLKKSDPPPSQQKKANTVPANPVPAALPAGREVIFQPNPGPQTDFLSSSEQEVLYGGAAGGGKSFAMLADPVRYFENPHAQMLLVRKSTEELRELIAKSKELYYKYDSRMKFLEREKTWVAPSGATLWLSYLDRDEDVSRYQGQAFSWIGFDELTQWSSPYAWNYMRSRLRTTKQSGLDLYQRATSNPGGVGHQWVKKMFVDPEVANKPFYATDSDSGKILRYPEGHSSGKGGQPLFKRRFIPATLFDNPYLSEDGTYEANLLSLPEAERKKLLEGSWDIQEGAAFPEFSIDKHVVEAFDIPRHWRRFRAGDWGYSSYSGVLWFAVAPSGELFVYNELYVSQMTADKLAREINQIERGQKVSYGVLDSSVWRATGDGGPSIADQMITRGCRWRKADRSAGSRVAGKQEIHRRLQNDPESGAPTLYIFDHCRHLIGQLPNLPLDKKNPEDVDTKSEDHLYDALRYGLMSRPTPFDETTSIPQEYKPVDTVFGY